MPPTLVRTASLELTSFDQFIPARPAAETVRFVRAAVPSPEFNRFLYAGVGSDHYWRDRLGWTFDQWYRLLAAVGYETWYLTIDGTPAGYAELDARDSPNVEIVCFGLLPAFIGRGRGGWLLDRVTGRAFELGRRVWLHPCTLDGPNALPAYRRRGYRLFKVEQQMVDLPAEPPAPWPGAARERRSA